MAAIIRESGVCYELSRNLSSKILMSQLNVMMDLFRYKLRKAYILDEILVTVMLLLLIIGKAENMLKLHSETRLQL